MTPVVWRTATSLDVLLRQLNAAAPDRSTLSDGSIGDAAHASRDSDHNPWLTLKGVGVVTARDFTHDPDDGLDCNKLAAALVASGDPRIKYLIWNGQWWRPGIGWRPYFGSNPHNKHLHLSVVSDAEGFDSPAAWDVSLAGSPAGAVLAPVSLTPRRPRMYLVRDPRTGAVYLITADGVRPLSNREEWACFQWLLDDDRDPDVDAKRLGLGDTPDFNTRFFQVVQGVLARPVAKGVG